MNRSQLIAEIESLMPQYAAAGAIDRVALDRYIVNCLKDFGASVMDSCEDILTVRNYKVDLPENFYSWVVGYKCDIKGIVGTEEDKKYLQSSFLVKERTEQEIDYTFNARYNFPLVEGDSCKLIREEVYFWDQTKKTVKFGYDNFEKLRLIPGRKKANIEKDCENLLCESKHQVTIQGGYLQTNFEEGEIYLRYRGLPVDEDGEYTIPEIQRGKFKEYVIYYCIVRILEALTLSGDDPNVVNKLSYFDSKKREYYEQAKKDAIAEGLTGWASRIKKANRRRKLKYEFMYDNI